MRKLFKIQYGILVFIFMSMIACKKDTPYISEDNNKDIRVLKVQYLGHDYNSSLIFGSSNSPIIFRRECSYNYDIDGRLNYIENNGEQRVLAEYDNFQIKLTNSQVENASTIALYWMNSTINYHNNKIENIIATTRYPSISPLFMSDQIKMNVNRTVDGKLKSIINNDVSDFVGLYLQLNTEVISYDANGLPDKIKGMILPIEDFQYPLSLSWEFAFLYNKADDIPNKLKRLVNEELLFSNRYGVTNYDMFYLDSTRNFSQFGEGNWLVSFGLPQYYILEDKSSHVISQRTTNYYQIDSVSGNKELLKTKVEDFPYIHDAEAKTLEIAGLKIWYEFVE